MLKVELGIADEVVDVEEELLEELEVRMVELLIDDGSPPEIRYPPITPPFVLLAPTANFR